MDNEVTPAANAQASNRQSDLPARFKALALEHAVGLLDEMFDSADDALSHMSESAENDVDRALYSDAMRTLSLERAEITRVFIETLGNLISRSGAGTPAQPFETLDLSPEGASAENLAMAAMAAEAGKRHRAELAGLQARLQSLAQTRPGLIEPSAMTPASVCYCWAEATSGLGVDSEIKLLIYKLFAHSVMGGLGDAYTRLEALLIRHNVAPQGRRAAAAIAQPPPRPAHGQRWSQRLARLRHEVAPENHFATGEVLAGLSRLRVADGSEAPVPSEFVEALQQALRAGQSDSIPRSLKPEERRLIGMVTAMFNQLIGETETAGASYLLLQRLRIPALKIALIDSGFFREADHPARRLVNDIATLDCYADGALFTQAHVLIERLTAEFKRDPAVLETVADALYRFGASARQTQRKGLVTRAKRLALLEIRQQTLGRRLPDAIKHVLLKAWGPLLAHICIEHDLDSPQWHEAGTVLTRILDAVAPPQSISERETRYQEQARLVVIVRRHLAGLSLGRARIAELLESLQQAFEQALDSHAPAITQTDEQLLAQPVACTDDETVFDDNGNHDATNAAFDRVLSNHIEAPATASRPITRMDPAAEHFVAAACQPGAWFQVYAGGEHQRWLRVATYDKQRQMVSFSNSDGKIVYERPALVFAQDLQAERSRPVSSDEPFDRKLANIISPKNAKNKDIIS